MWTALCGYFRVAAQMARSHVVFGWSAIEIYRCSYHKMNSLFIYVFGCFGKIEFMNSYRVLNSQRIEVAGY